MAAKFLINFIARILPLTIAAIFAIYSDIQTVKIIAYGCGVLILAIAEYIGIYRPLANLEEYKKKILDHYFGGFIETAAIGDDKVTIRINIMVKRWHWVSWHFFQYYQNGMAGNSDANLHFDIRKGFCGKVFKEKLHEVRFIELKKISKKRAMKVFSFTESEAEITTNIRAIACIPLFIQTKTIRGNPNTKFFGILNVDTTDNKGVDFLRSEEIQKQIKALAAFAQIILA